LEITQASLIPYVNTIWREDSTVRLESLAIAGTSGLIEDAYGEEAVYPVLDMNLTDFHEPEFRKEFLRPFPAVKSRLDGWQEILDRTSRKDGTKLEIRYDGGKGLVVLYLDAVIESKDGKLDSELKDIEKSLGSLKEAYAEIENGP
jgi:hypothetical protein